MQSQIAHSLDNASNHQNIEIVSTTSLSNISIQNNNGKYKSTKMSNREQASYNQTKKYIWENDFIENN